MHIQCLYVLISRSLRHSKIGSTIICMCTKLILIFNMNCHLYKMIVRLAKNLISFKLINGKPTLNSMAQTNNTATTLRVCSVIALLIKSRPWILQLTRFLLAFTYFHIMIVLRQITKINEILECLF